MKRISVLLALIFGPTLTAYSDELEVRRLPDRVHEKATFLNDEYLLHVPKQDDAKSRLPMLVFLHGAGGKGDDIAKARRIATPAFEGMQKFAGTSCLFVAPQCVGGTGERKGVWLPEDLDLFLQHVKDKLQVDESRIYLMGNSMGGYGSWVWAASSPELFAAVAPIVGGLGIGGPKDIAPNLDRWAKNLSTIPIWAFHGAQDKVVPVDRSKRMIALIKEKGSTNAKLTIYPNEGHGAGRRVYSDAEFYHWMFNQQRD